MDLQIYEFESLSSEESDIEFAIITITPDQ